MNKKLTLFVFAIGIGAASASAWASNCYHTCFVEYRACLKSGQPTDVCQGNLYDCQDRCEGSVDN